MMIYLIHSISTVNHHRILLEQVKFFRLNHFQSFSDFYLDEDNPFLSDHYPSATGVTSSFHVDPFGMIPPPIRDTNSPINITFPTTNNNFFVQSQPQLIPTRLAAPTLITPITPQSPLTMKKLSLNPPKKKTDPFSDLLDFNDPIPPPPESPTFDPYA